MTRREARDRDWLAQYVAAESRRGWTWDGIITW
jgi:hypothetical protein